MDAPMNPNDRKVYRKREETVYDQAAPVQPVRPVQPVTPPPATNAQYSYTQSGDLQTENVQQGYYDAAGNLVQKEEHVVDDTYTRRLNTLDRTTQVIYFLLGLLEILLALRFVFRIINSDTTNGFVNFIYNLTGPFVAPFNGIFNDQAVTRGSVVEFSTLIAMAIYALIAWGIVKLLNVLLRPNPSSREVFTNTRRMS